MFDLPNDPVKKITCKSESCINYLKCPRVHLLKALFSCFEGLNFGADAVQRLEVVEAA